MDDYGRVGKYGIYQDNQDKKSFVVVNAKVVFRLMRKARKISCLKFKKKKMKKKLYTEKDETKSKADI